MAVARAATAAALLVGAMSLSMRQDEAGDPILDMLPDDAFPEDVVLDNITTRKMKVRQWADVRMGPPMLVSEACSVGWSSDSYDSEWTEVDPPIFPEAGIGARRRMYAIDDMEYQLFLPRKWTNNTLYPYPTIIYLHGHAERKWSMMNSESLPRLLARNQTTSFDNRSCWCLDSSFASATAAKETDDAAGFDAQATEDLASPMADCSFPDNFNAIVVMPRGWEKTDPPGWNSALYTKVTAITKFVMERFNGDSNNVIVTGVAEGGKGAIEFGALGLVSSVIVADSPSTTYSSGLDGIPVWVTGDAASGSAGNDALVASLRARPAGITRYTRYTAAPRAADPEYGGSWGHGSDLLYRDQRLWQWAFHHTITGGRTKWGIEHPDFVVMH